jgi:uroporphyrinogen-III synthase
VRPLLVTRAADDAAALAAKLGPHAIVAPCITYVSCDTSPPDLPDADLLVTSPRAIPALTRAPARWRRLVLSPATAEAVRAAGQRVDVEAPGGAAMLARLARPGPLVHATSDLGGDEVRGVRPDAVLWVVYRTICPDDLPPAARDALAGEFDVLFASPSAVRNFERLAPGALARATRVLCHGRTTLAAVPRDAELVRLS